MPTREQCNELYRRHAPGAFRRAQRLLSDGADADDVVHDVFVALFERYEHFRGASEVSTYVYSAVTHACLNRLRNRKKRLRLLEERARDVGPRQELGAAAEARLLARDLLERLPVPLAEVAIYHHLEELSQREIARILGCSHTHVAELLERLSRWITRQEQAVCQR
jgi:RNA polymerase sigma-70 factor (ECF subfamily)